MSIKYRSLAFLSELLVLNLGFLAVDGIFFSVRSQNIPPTQIPVNPTIPELPSKLKPLLSPEELQEILPPDANKPEQNFDISGSIQVNKFEFMGNTKSVFSDKRLAKELQEFTNKDITFTELLQAAAKITNLYAEEGYVTSGAYIPAQTLTGCLVKPQQTSHSCDITIQIVEGSLEEIRISRDENSKNFLHDSYVRSRLNLATGKPLNIRNLKQALQLLQLNPLIKNLSAELSAGTIPGTNLLKIKIEEANTDNIKIIADNSRNPSIGSFRRGLEIEESNLTGLGDSLNLAYNNTDGSNAINANYTIPINPRNGTIGFSYSNTESNIIEQPFDELDIKSNSHNFELSLRQPIIEKANEEFTEELALGFTLNRKESNSSILGVNFPISVGADAQGSTRISALRFFQEWNRKSLQQVFVARSQFSLGVGTFGATINNQAPDSRSFAWRGQLLWLHSLGSQTDNPKLKPKILLRSDLQLATRSLLPLEQFTLGGVFNGRGYRQDAIFSDNGFFSSADFQLPIYNTNNGENILQLIPFIDVGTTWNSSSKPNPDSNTLASLGLGLQWQMGEKFKARLDYGIPLVKINSIDRTLQDNGVYFSMQYNLF